MRLRIDRRFVRQSSARLARSCEGGGSGILCSGFYGLFYGRITFCCKTLQFCATQCETVSFCSALKNMLRNALKNSLNYETVALPAELRRHFHRTSRRARAIPPLVLQMHVRVQSPSLK